MTSHGPKEPSIDNIRIELRGIGASLRGFRLIVPAYQRDYAWEENQVRDMLGDIHQAIREGAAEYFLGTIVTSRANGDGPEVTDGQQRLATVTIILAAIRDYFRRTNDGDRASEIEKNYLHSRDLRTMEIQTNLQMNVHDNEFFKRAIVEGRDDQPILSSHRKIAGAKKIVAEYLAKVAEVNVHNPTSALLDWVDFVDKRAKVIWVEVPDSSNAFTIFETLNDRGLELAISDLLKNYLFYRAGSRRLADVQASWIEMAGLLEATDEKEILVVFLQHYWSSIYGLTRKRELFKEVKRRVTSVQNAVDLVADLAGSARHHLAILNPSHEVWSQFGASASGCISIFNLLNATQIRPLLLAVIKTLSPAEVRRALRFLVDVAVRVVVVGSRSGTLEEAYSAAAKRIHEGHVTTASALRTELRTVFPDDHQFRDAFAVATVSRDQIARYYLCSLEAAEAGEDSPELIPSPNTDDVNLEHVLPSTPSVAWQHVSAEHYRSLHKRIGNLAILRAGDNARVGNADFAEKRKVYRRSKFRLTSQIAKNAVWDETAITDRQRHLAELAVRTWSGKFS